MEMYTIENGVLLCWLDFSWNLKRDTPEMIYKKEATTKN